MVPDWFHHSKPEVANAVKNMFPVLREAGATLHEISIPKLDAVHLSLIITIITKCVLLESFSEQWKSPLCFENFINLRIAKLLREKIISKPNEFVLKPLTISGYFQQVDALITPTTACTAPLISEDVMGAGESDLPQLMN